MLKGIRILDLADENGSFCSKLFADLGASVIKIEKPGGDPSRKIAPFCAGLPENENSLFFAYHNTNKLSITLDIGNEPDRIKFFRLLGNTDILIETFKPGFLATIGLTFEKLRDINPALIHVSITGFGQRGHRKDYLSSDIVASAYGGQMYVCGFPSEQPLSPFGGQSHFVSSLFGAVNILLAVRQRALTGKGQFIDISAQEAVASTLDNVMVNYFYENNVTKRQGSLYGNSFFCILPCKDGYIQLTLLQQWKTFVELLAAEGMANDMANIKWSDEKYRIKNINHIINVVREWTRKHSVQELFEIGQSMRFPWSPVFSPEDVMSSPQLKERQFFRQIDYPNNINIISPGLPYKFSSFLQQPCRRAPFLGEHNSMISTKGISPKPDKSQTALPAKDNSIYDVSNKQALKGIKILDFTWVLAGPYATRIFADHGAEVIKVQSHKTSNGAEANITGYFNTWNRNKRSITLDLNHPESRDIILKLAAICDVVVENFSPRVMSNWGLGYDQLKESNPNIIMAGVSAMGQTGPWKNYVGYGPTFHALSGLTHMTSIGQNSTAGLGHAYADSVTGLYSALAILAALEYRDKTGTGQYIDISGYETACTLLGPALMRAQLNQKNFMDIHNYYDHSHNIPAAPSGCYRCLGEDRWCVFAVFNEEQWFAFCRTAGKAYLCADKRFSNIDKRKTNREKLNRLIEEWTKEMEPEVAVDILQQAGIPAGVVQNAEDLAKDSHLKARNFFIELEHPVLGKKYTDSTPANYADYPTKAWKPAPLLGQDNNYIFADLLGFTEEEISCYIKKGIIF